MDHTYFEKQRDLLLQEIGASLDSVVYNLDVLNRSLNGSVSVGKEFDNVGRLWSHFYDGANQLKEKNSQPSPLQSNSPSDSAPSPSHLGSKSSESGSAPASES
ncbi:Dolichyl-diphosphooligosaccharide-protein glycosyltransferase subunit dad1 [Meyerozyma guilliermondii]